MPPCNCHPPFPRPEPFSPLPRPGKVPDWGKWIRDRLAEKGALLVFPTRATFPEEGAWPNLYLDRETGAVYRWENRTGYAVLVDPREGNDVLVYDSVAAFPDEGEQGKLYIAADTGSLHRWGGEGYVALLPGKADKVVPAAGGNFAALTQDGNLADSGKKPADFATAEQGAKADTAVQPEDLPERLPNPQALKFVSGSAGTYDEYDGSSEKTISHALSGTFGLVCLSDRTDWDRTADNGAFAATPRAVKTVNDKVTAIEGKIPVQATAQNQLADKAFVNSSIATETATFRGTFNLVTDLQLPPDATHVQVAHAIRVALVAAGVTPDDNDYVFVQIPQDLEHTDAMKQVDRYKCTVVGSSQTWAYEWTLNNSSFTAAQWAAINSGITSGDVTKLGGIAAGAQVNVIETVKVNGTALTPQDKAVNIPVPTFDNAVTKDSANGVKSSGIWSAIWGALTALPTGFSSLYDWVVAQLGLKRDYTDLSYDTTETVEVPALHATMTSQQGGQVIVEYDLLCTEEVPDPPQVGRSYTWKADGAAFYVTQGVSALQTTWVLYSYTDEPLGGVTTQNATQGFYPDVEFRPSNAVITIHKTTAQKQVTTEDTIALESKTVPTSRTVNGKALSADVTLTGADIAVSGTDATKIDAALADKASKSDATLTERWTPTFSLTAAQKEAFSQTPGASDNDYALTVAKNEGGAWTLYIGSYNAASLMTDANGNLVLSGGDVRLGLQVGDLVATPSGYRLGPDSATNPNRDKPLASEAEAEALRQGKANRASNPTAGNLAALDASGNPTDSGVKPSDKLDSTSAAPAFSSDSSTQYAVGSHVTYNGKLYVCTTATTGGTWDASKWTADTMTDPDAVLDITAQNQLRVVAKDGTVLWAQGYDLSSTSSATLACDAVNNFTFADGATSQAFALPTAPTGKVGDFGLDIDNSANTGAATITLTGLDTTFSVVVPEGENLTDMLAIAAGELARFYVTLSTFRINNLPTWHIVKQVVENGGAQS